MLLRNLNTASGQSRVLGSPYLGILGSQVPASGQHGASLIYPSLALPADANKQYSIEMLTFPSEGQLFVWPDGTYQYDGTGVVGVQQATAQLYEDGQALGSPITIYFDTGATYEVYGVSINPTSVSLAGNAQRTFEATVWGTSGINQDVTWTADGGAITSGGVFTAPAATTVDQTITITARSAASPAHFGTATVTVAANVSAPTPTVTGLTVSPKTATVAGLANRQFSKTVTGTNNPPTGVTWATTGGEIDASGWFTAPAATGVDQTITITATSTFNGGVSDTAVVTVPAAAVAGSEYPAPSDVRLGVTYGPAGELVGTMVGGGIGFMLGRGIGVTLDGGLVIGVIP